MRNKRNLPGHSVSDGNRVSDQAKHESEAKRSDLHSYPRFARFAHIPLTRKGNTK